MEQKKLYRSATNRTICGVCGGIGEYLNIDPTLVRLIWALCSVASCGTALLVYIIAAVIMPGQPVVKHKKGRGRGAPILRSPHGLSPNGPAESGCAPRGTLLY